MVTVVQAKKTAVQAGLATQAAVKTMRKRVTKEVVHPAQRAVLGSLGMGGGERMTKVDTAWLRMDSDTNLMMIIGVWVLKPGITREALAERLNERLLKYRRFTQKVVEDPAGATWVTDPRFSMDNHLLVETLARAGKGKDQADSLKARVSALAMQALDPAHPLWQFHLVEDYTGPDGQAGSALIARIHHCIADGIALIAVMMSMVDGGSAPPERKRKNKSEGVEDWITETLLKPFTSVAVKAIGMAGDNTAKGVSMAGSASMQGMAGFQQTMQMLMDPQRAMQSMMQTVTGAASGFEGGLGAGLAGLASNLPESMQKNIPQALDMARMGYQVASDAMALALMQDDSPTRLKGKAGHEKRVAWCEPLPLEDVRAVSKGLGCSINDVLLACVAGAIGEYLRSKGDDPTGLEIRAMVPVNLRPLDQAYKLGNRFGLAPVVLPIGIDNPIERVFEVRARMSALKGSYQPMMAFSLLALAGLLIKPAQDAMLNLFGKKTTAVMTNVPGPKEKLKFCGSTLDQTMFWVPQSGDVGLGVSILSYGGGVQFGVMTDSTLCPDPEGIIDNFEPEFIKMMWTVLMLPWDGPANA